MRGSEFLLGNEAYCLLRLGIQVFATSLFSGVRRQPSFSWHFPSVGFFSLAHRPRTSNLKAQTLVANVHEGVCLSKLHENGETHACVRGCICMRASVSMWTCRMCAYIGALACVRVLQCTSKYACMHTYICTKLETDLLNAETTSFSREQQEIVWRHPPLEESEVSSL